MRGQKLLGWLGMLGMSGLLVYAVYTNWPREQGPRPYVAPSFAEPSEAGHKRAFHEICPLINRPEVLALVETPPEVHGQGTSFDPDGMSYLSCNVKLPTRAVRLDVGRGVDVAAMTEAATGGHKLTVLGRPAIYEQEHLIAPTARLTIAWDPSDPSAYASIAVFQNQGYADEATLVAMAELIVPNLKR
ncbi:MAG: hypothetical protein HOV71_19750 [Hamadaea sp.]|nr:hypothetical protein [Hamadaea sp.]NUR50366.1 hypothetical protein [Hamadaea sp.]NUT04913.1 hypothetical protein [Hamadaea sp.]